jgi:hypothetical protein
LSQKRIFFAEFFGEKFLKIITSVPGWANCRLLGDTFRLGSYFKLQKWRELLGFVFQETSYALISTKMGWAKFWTMFIQTRLVTLAMGHSIYCHLRPKLHTCYTY